MEYIEPIRWVKVIGVALAAPRKNIRLILLQLVHYCEYQRVNIGLRDV